MSGRLIVLRGDAAHLPLDDAVVDAVALALTRVRLSKPMQPGLFDLEAGEAS